MAKFDCYGGGYDPAFDEDGERHLDFDVDLKWSAWSAHRADWDDRYPDIWLEIRKLQPGDTATITTAPRKEIRYGRVTIERHGLLDWRAKGYFNCSWDEPYELEDTLGIVSVEEHLWAQYFGHIDVDEYDDDDSPVVKAALAKYLEEHGKWAVDDAREIAANAVPVSSWAWHESLPFAMSTMEPGVDNDFEVCSQFFGELMQLIDAEEDRAMQMSTREWNLLCDCYQKPELKEKP
jgi:hypothetical protein